MNDTGKHQAGRVLLLIASAIVGLIALWHIGIIIGGPDMYRSAGAGAKMAEMAEQGSWIPAILTLIITLILGTWSLYAYAGAVGRPRLPALRVLLLVIAGIFIVRGLAGMPFLLTYPAQTPSGVVRFVAATSLGSLAIGLLYLFGTLLRWKLLSSTRK